MVFYKNRFGNNCWLKNVKTFGSMGAKSREHVRACEQMPAKAFAWSMPVRASKKNRFAKQNDSPCHSPSISWVLLACSPIPLVLASPLPQIAGAIVALATIATAIFPAAALTQGVIYHAAASLVLPSMLSHSWSGIKSHDMSVRTLWATGFIFILLLQRSTICFSRGIFPVLCLSIFSFLFVFIIMLEAIGLSVVAVYALMDNILTSILYIYLLHVRKDLFNAIFMRFKNIFSLVNKLINT